MLPLLLSLLDLYPADLPARLDAPSFAVRTRADDRLRGCMSWANALRLEHAARRLGPEGRRRASLILRDYWIATPDDMLKWPHIDALNPTPCASPNAPLVQHYLDRARESGCSLCGPDWPAYRLATMLLVEDLRRLRIPPAFTRSMLSVMDAHTVAWERRYAMPPQRLPE